MGAEATAESGGGGGGGGTPFSTTLIPNSVWFDGSADSMETGSLSAQVDSGNFVVATWMQRNNFSIADQAWFELFNASTSRLGAGFLNSDNTLAWRQDFFFRETTDAAYRDIAWYHIIVSVQPTNSGTTNGDGCQIFINGILQDSTTGVSGSGYGPTFSPQSQGYIFILGKGNPSSGSAHFKGYLAQTVYLDGHSIQSGDVSVSDFLSTQTFGTNGTQFIPKSNADVALLASNAGANSFCLDYSNSSALGNDISTKGNDFTPTSMTSANQSGNTPSKMYATMNPLISGDGGTVTFAEGNRRVTGTAGGDSGTFSTLPLPTTGTTEFQMTTNNGDGRVGICCYDNCLAAAAFPSNNTFGGSAVGFDAAYAYAEDGTLRQRTLSSQTTTAFGGAWTTNDVITVRYNADANELNFLKNNVAQGTTVSTVAGLTYYAAVARFNNYDCTLHFDEAEFPHTIGVGNKTINTADLAAPSFQGKDFFDATLYTGNSATQIVGGGSDSKFTASAWIKSRSATTSNMLYDRVRGAATDLHSNAPDAQVFDADTLTSFLQRGGELGADSQVNLNTGTFVLWQWLAGSSATSGITNGTGATTSTLVTSAAQNFSVGTFPGTGSATTVGHSLNGAPEAIFVKNANSSGNWCVYHEGTIASPATAFLELNTTTVRTVNSAIWSNTEPTSTIFTVGTDPNVNGSTDTMSFMAFRSIPGVCKVGSYTGNGTTNGPFVNLEFKPRWVLIRRSDSGGDPWCVIDTARTPFNSSTNPLVLQPNTTDIDTSGTLGSVDFLANGIKFNSITSAGNGSLGNFVYIAMADIGGHGTLPPIYGI